MENVVKMASNIDIKKNGLETEEMKRDGKGRRTTYDSLGTRNHCLTMISPATELC